MGITHLVIIVMLSLGKVIVVGLSKRARCSLDGRDTIENGDSEMRENQEDC